MSVNKMLNTKKLLKNNENYRLFNLEEALNMLETMMESGFSESRNSKELQEEYDTILFSLSFLWNIKILDDDEYHGMVGHLDERFDVHRKRIEDSWRD